jgi:chemotaxis regulatin CheY-phosphate phosphatase CheZ
MSQGDLRDLLTELHSRLSTASTLDPEARDLLTTVLHDIEKVLERSGESRESTQPRVEALAVRFEAEHPALAIILRQLVDALQKAGI